MAPDQDVKDSLAIIDLMQGEHALAGRFHGRETPTAGSLTPRSSALDAVVVEAVQIRQPAGDRRRRWDVARRRLRCL